MLRRVIPKMLDCPDCALSEAYKAESPQPIALDDSTVKFWYPTLFSFYDIIMNAEDLEIRRLYVLQITFHYRFDVIIQSSIQSVRFYVFNTEGLRPNFPSRILGYYLSRTSFPYFCRAQVFVWLIAVEYSRRYECLAINDHDTSSTRPNWFIYVFLWDSGKIFRRSSWAPLRLHMPRLVAFPIFV